MREVIQELNKTRKNYQKVVFEKNAQDDLIAVRDNINDISTCINFVSNDDDFCANIPDFRVVNGVAFIRISKFRNSSEVAHIIFSRAGYYYEAPDFDDLKFLIYNFKLYLQRLNTYLKHKINPTLEE